MRVLFLSIKVKTVQIHFTSQTPHAVFLNEIDVDRQTGGEKQKNDFSESDICNGHVIFVLALVLSGMKFDVCPLQVKAPADELV